jgi:glycine cleavage system H lipoate-binding protein/ABC-type phosphate transport system substrate-binding protein
MLASQWAGEYSMVEKHTKINVQKVEYPATIQKKGIALTEDVEAYRKINPTAWSLIVGRDIVVPVTNGKNPMSADISSTGLSASRLSAFAGNGATWKDLLNVKSDNPAVPLHVYLINDPEVISSVSAFIRQPVKFLNARMMKNTDEFVSAIRQDPVALGFCKLAQVVNRDRGVLADDMKLVEIDKNGNGRIDFTEDIYSDLTSFSKGVWIGKYPKALTGAIYAVSAEKPENDAEVRFLNWILSQGQTAIAANGFSELAYNERQSQLNKINMAETIEAARPNEANTWMKLILWGLLGFIVISFVLDRIFRRRPHVQTQVPDSQSLKAFEENSVVVPQGIYFDKTHTWAFRKKNGLVKVGIDDFLQHVTGPITRIEMKKPGETIKKGDILFTLVQVGKQLSVYSPVSGTIIAINKSLHSDPLKMNTAPYSSGWVCLVEPINWHLEVGLLLVAEKYKSWLTQEFVRLKDFLSNAVGVTSPEFDRVVMQDGGVLRDNVLSGLSPEQWDDFQTEFLDRELKQTI